ncbi:NAD(P)H-dependent oxidoreductase [Oceanobacillus jeddahense]|uniref:NAD(P)H-dependent oxidoreductase n=1 Tax=Oceanobacillus jeddahense TaxID=1462527 RepID=A0ABY5JRA9_9BACI|nr:NAD(P)H-dependent oxidoreductase [Oceanobacillus jeddahense]UUI02335.1 NAD(P)H-dependent oxidoreductase [Oceanobacillus jeddahense]
MKNLQAKNIAVIYAYPNDSGFNSAIFSTVEKNIHPRHHVKVIDLYQDNFHPVLYFDNIHKRRDLQFDSEVEEYREIVSWASHLIFIFPIWWGGMPAILKGFVDRVFAKGFAYEYKGVIPIGLLKNKTGWIITTHDTPSLYVKLMQHDYGRVLKKQILKMCGITPTAFHTMSFLRYKKEKSRKRFLEQLTRKAQKI